MKHSFDFALTTYCQAKCRSCARTNDHTGEKEDWLELKHMKLENFETILKNTKKELGWIQFCGEVGDPCMHPQIEEFTDIALKYVENVNINTNGGLRQPAWYERLAKQYANRIHIKFGVDGADHDTNWLYREGVDWQRAMGNMTAYFQNGGNGKWHFLIFDWNWCQIPEAVSMAKEIGCDIEFKWNHRDFGRISDENKIHAQQLLEEYYYGEM